MSKHFEIIAKSYNNYSLYDHLLDVKNIVIEICKHLKYDADLTIICIYSAILHDIGKANKIFQDKLKNPNNIYDVPYRHEIATLFFISIIPKEYLKKVIEMFIAHHKSIIDDYRKRGIIDLIDEYGIDRVFNMHLGNIDDSLWLNNAIDILNELGIKCDYISIDDAKNNFYNSINIIEELSKENGYSELRGVLMAADYFASAVNCSDVYINKLFKNPNIEYYNQLISDSYPLSLKPVISNKKHTLVISPTGSGKTNYLIRRTKGRFFYVLPYTASINAMYQRIKTDLNDNNNELDIRILHSSSKLQIDGNNYSTKMIQSKVGSTIKVLTPHQIMNIVFGTLGYEAMIIDLKNSDVILDEIHTYNDRTQGAVIKMIEILNQLNCNIHIGSATIPSKLYNKIIDVLGSENVYEVSLSSDELKTYNRHIIHKLKSWNDSFIYDEINRQLKENNKVLIVRNRVSDAQVIYDNLKYKFENIPIMLIHSRFKRGRRNNLEAELMRLNSLNNTPCIVVSTQVVEVSLNISFDVLFTDNAPIDSLVQRFGRINRDFLKRTNGELKPVYVISHIYNQTNLPYSDVILDRTFNVIPDNTIFEETNIQQYIDYVYPNIDLIDVDNASIFKNGNFVCKKLQNKNKSLIFEQLDILCGVAIMKKDIDEYLNTNFEDKILLEIPIFFESFKKMKITQLIHENAPNKPFIIPDDVYTDDYGLISTKLKDKESYVFL